MTRTTRTTPNIRKTKSVRFAAAVLALVCPLLLLSVPARTAQGKDGQDGSSVLVKTAALTRKSVESTLSAYGQVLLDPRQTAAVSFPRKGTVERLMVAQGQMVRKGAPLASFRSAPEELAAFRQAQLGVDYAGRDLERVRRMLGQHLATTADLATAEKTLEDARSALKAQRSRGTGTPSEVVRAPFDGIVSQVAVKQGDIVPAGGLVLQIGRNSGLRAVLGVEPEDVSMVADGMEVRITPVFDHDRPVEGRIAAVYGIINPQTRLVDVVVALSSGGAGMVPGMQVRGKIVLGTTRSFVVPRSAVLRDADGKAGLFQVKDGHAVHVPVTCGVETDGEVAVSGSLDPALPVVVSGNYELRDGTAVREEGR
ncbi:efflux transporter, RND family, MFP subunit [Desulfovibrio sp. X2]|uniref:efflux RND transporter periplasmic adaptor subunit n=1 Tax=Desulfovibrio sp. X2 TaxID=941449 RepID=UPI0003588FA8|nr:efflux RND transporter periplasmic adaptor subunit [Desulfovibrio sp. X2]EPR43087.1 efflux transporter, RND family, MFP subunit [Desulfovibrio sp. X2]